MSSYKVGHAISTKGRQAQLSWQTVKSGASANRVMHSITKWIENKLQLKVNATKSKVTQLIKSKYLGFGFYFNEKDQQWKSRPHQDSIVKFNRYNRYNSRSNSLLD